MTEPEVPDFVSLFPAIPAELQGFAEEIRQLMKRNSEEMYLAGFKAALEAVGKVLCAQQAHILETIVVDDIGIPILHHLHTTIEEQRKH